MDEELCMVVREMLQVLLDCFTHLTGRTEKVTAVVVSTMPYMASLIELFATL